MTRKAQVDQDKNHLSNKMQDYQVLGEQQNQELQVMKSVENE